MRISSANMPAQVSRAQPSHPSTADRVSKQQKAGQDQYRRGAASDVIDAEYVEFYSPSKQTFAQERQRLDNRVEPPNDSSTEKISSGLDSNGIGRYQLAAHEAPPPGTYIDTFA